MGFSDFIPDTAGNTQADSFYDGCSTYRTKSFEPPRDCYHLNPALQNVSYIQRMF